MSLASIVRLPAEALNWVSETLDGENLPPSMKTSSNWPGTPLGDQWSGSCQEPDPPRPSGPRQIESADAAVARSVRAVADMTMARRWRCGRIFSGPPRPPSALLQNPLIGIVADRGWKTQRNSRRLCVTRLARLGWHGV